MSQTERLYKISHLLGIGQCLTRQRLLDELDISPATLKRDLAHLRDRMNMPVTFDRERGGWCLDRSKQVVGTQYELPGLWLSAEEIHALLTMQHLLGHLDAGGLLGRHIAPLTDRLTRILGDGTGHAEDLARRIRVLTVGARRVQMPHFQAVGSALLRRLRVMIEYHAVTHPGCRLPRKGRAWIETRVWVVVVSRRRCHPHREYDTYMLLKGRDARYNPLHRPVLFISCLVWEPPTLSEAYRPISSPLFPAILAVTIQKSRSTNAGRRPL